MRANTRKGKFHRARKQFALEQLEARQLMAADLLSGLDSVDELAVDTSSATASASVLTTAAAATNDSVAAATAERRASSTRVTSSIPTASLAPRSFDGTGNNLANAELGSTGEQLLRVSSADYADGISAAAGEDRPSAREISNAIVAQDEETAANDRKLSAFIYVWGQFIDHDIDLTEPPTTGREALNIAVPTGDEFFDPDGSGGDVIRLSRSRFDATTGTSTDNPREQINQITAWIDGSMVYGSDQAAADSLRTFVGGTLRISDGNLLPTDAEGDFVGGDVRVNENVELTSMHTLFVREHNWWAAKIAAQNPALSDEEIYQQARAIVIAEIQSITYNEFLPALLGSGALSNYQGYDPTIDPSVANEFSTAAFRMHSFINDDVEFFGNDGRAVHEEVALREAFNNPDLLRETGADSIIKYLASTTAQELDTQIVDSLRNFLFGQPGQGGFDLASLNIQRGRDHGLADYNSVREAYGLARVDSFADISSDVGVQQALESLYGTVDNIDLWVGGLAEDHVPGSSTGELIQTIVADQFERLRDGDRYWYENIFSSQEVAQIERTQLSDIIQRNTTISNVQDDVFFMRAEVTGQVFADTNGNGRQDRRENALRGVTVELLNDEGEVIASTVTDRSGRYHFDQFAETGDFQVRVIPPARMTTAVDTRDVLISRGDVTINGVNFALRSVRATVQEPIVRPRTQTSRTDRLAAVDTAFDTNTSVDVLRILDEFTRTRARR